MCLITYFLISCYNFVLKIFCLKGPSFYNSRLKGKKKKMEHANQKSEKKKKSKKSTKKKALELSNKKSALNILEPINK